MYVFEAILNTSKLLWHMGELSHVIPQITRSSIKARSACFVVVGCCLDTYLTHDQRRQLDEYVDGQIIHHYVCKLTT
jgi:hypothetical protein